jgi:hypothetical protein
MKVLRFVVALATSAALATPALAAGQKTPPGQMKKMAAGALHNDAAAQLRFGAAPTATTGQP